MTRIIYLFITFINKLHNKLFYYNDYKGLNLTDKQLHFIVIGLFGFCLLAFIQPLFAWISKHFGLLFITFSYVFTIVLMLSFAIEVGQAYSGSGTMDFYDIASGILGFFTAFAIYLIIYIVYKSIKKIGKKDNQG